MGMNDTKDPIHELDKRLAVLEEKMEKTLAKNESAIDRLRVDMANFKTDAEKRETAAEKRDKTLLIALGGLMIGSIAIGVTILGLWLG